MILFNLIESGYFIYFLIAVFIEHNASGIGNRIIGAGKSVGNNINHFGEGNFNRGLDYVGQRHHEYSESIADPSHRRIHPDYNFQVPEVYHSLGSQSERGYSNYDNQPAPESEITQIIDGIIHQPMDIEVHPTALSMLDELMSDALKLHYPTETKIDLINHMEDIFKRNFEGIKDGYESLNKKRVEQNFDQSMSWPQDSIDENKMVELMPYSGLMINKYHLDIFVKLHENQPRVLMRRIFEELIPQKELATMQATDYAGFKAIPPMMVKDVYDFVTKKAKPPIEYSEFMSALAYYLNCLRSKYKAEKVFDPQKKLDESIYNSLADVQTTTVELHFGTKVMIHKNILERLTSQYKDNSRKLMQKILVELIPAEKLVLLKNHCSIGAKCIPKEIRDALEGYLKRAAKPKLSHYVFMYSLRDFLKSLRLKYGMSEPTYFSRGSKS